MIDRSNKISGIANSSNLKVKKDMPLLIYQSVGSFKYSTGKIPVLMMA